MRCECFFCSNTRFVINKELGLPGENSIVWEDENVFVTPDLFPLIVGHFLIVTKNHYASWGSVGEDVHRSIQNAMHYLKSVILKGKNTVVFEHGAVIEHTGGACIDHAHIHVMPLKKDVHTQIETSDFIVKKPLRGDYSLLKELAGALRPYIYYQRNSDEGYVYPVNQLPSQFLRIIIARELKIQYNWKIMRIDGSAHGRFYDTLKLVERKKNEATI